MQWDRLTDIAYNDSALEGHARYLSGSMDKIPVRLGQIGSIILHRCKDDKLGEEGYKLTVTLMRITI